MVECLLIGDAGLANGRSAAVEVEALEALAAALAAVPTAFRSHLKQLGQFAGENLCGEHSSAALRAAASHCFSLLPHVTGKWILLPAKCCPHQTMSARMLDLQTCAQAQRNGFPDCRPGRAMERCRAGCASNRALAA